MIYAKTINKRYISRVLSNERNETNGLKFKYDREEIK